MSVTKHQQFEMGRVWRHEITPHPRNPRKIAKSAQHRLKGKVDEVGMITPICVNRRSMLIVGGHQRLAVLDKLEKYNAETQANDYQLDVSLCDLDDKQELEMLAFLNNPAAQGVFDLDVLAEMNLELGVDFNGTGFDQMDVDFMFDGDARFSHAFEDTRAVEDEKEKLEAIKAARAKGVENMRGQNSAEFYFVVVCRDEDEMGEIKKRLGVQPHEQFVSGDALLGAVPE